MNRSKLITASALATVLSAGAAQAEMSVSGLFAGAIMDNDGGLSHSNSTESFYISYSDSLDNGMGVSVTMSITSAIVTDVNIDTGMGTVMLGDGVDLLLTLTTETLHVSLSTMWICFCKRINKCCWSNMA